MIGKPVTNMVNHLRNFNEPLTLKIWGGNSECVRLELLAETPLVEHLDWKKYEFNIQIKTHINFISIQVHRGKDTPFYSNGNVLIDDFSNFQLINCDSSVHQIKEIQKNVPQTNLPYPWQTSKKPIRKASIKVYTYKWTKNKANITQNLSSILSKAFLKNVLTFNIHAPNQAIVKEQKMLLLDELKHLKYPKKWYQIKTHVEKYNILHSQ